tara:strand:- start:1368 stop:1739 length:372 start_codon:yes stop_codon:yes gene_type:complete
MSNFNILYGKSNKFRAKKTSFMGFTFDSKWEAERYGQLVQLERIGEITGLNRQIRYDIIVNEQQICKYIADFSYYEKDENGQTKFVVEDAKGIETTEFRLKKKLMKAIYGIEILVTKKNKRKK